MRFLVPALALSLAASQAPVTPQPADQLPLSDIKLPPGFTISLYAEGVTNARQMALGDKGTLFVGSRRARRVFAIVDKDGDKKADQVLTIANGLNSPSGLAFRNGSLYVAEVSRVIRFDEIESRLDSPPAPVVV